MKRLTEHCSSPCFLMMFLILCAFPSQAGVSRIKHEWIITHIDMKSRLQGWAVGATSADDKGLTAILQTDDGARHWINVTPPTLHNEYDTDDPSQRQVGAFFLDVQTAWVAVTKSSSNEQSVMLQVLRTSNAGQTWQSVQIRASQNTVDGPIYVDFLDHERGYIMATSACRGGAQDKAVYATKDGGRAWKSCQRSSIEFSSNAALPIADYATGLSFRNPKHGWYTFRYRVHPDPEPFVTADGGRRWRPQPLRYPLAYRYADTYPPRFFGRQGKAGVLPVQFALKSDETAVNFYRSQDGGRRWRSSSNVIVSGDPVYDILNEKHSWIWDDSGGSCLYATDDGGQSWTILRATPLLVEDHVLIQIDFVTSQVGWAIVRLGPNLTYQPMHVAATWEFRFFQTEDGGRTWKLGNP